MKLSTIIRAIVRPVVKIHSIDEWFIASTDEDFWAGAAVGVFCFPRDIPARATSVKILGDLTVAWWGRDTLVHKTEAS